MRRPLALLALCVLPAAAAAQVPTATPRALAMGNAYSALARGFEAIAWNPALLASTHGYGVTVGLPAGSAEVGNNAFSIDDILTYRDKDLSDADKQYLLDRVVNDDSTLQARGNFGVHSLGFSIGSFAVSLSSSGYVQAQASRDAVEFALNGNGAFAGTGNFFDLAGSGGRAWAATTLAGSYARFFPTPMGRLNVGVTAKRVWGNFLGLARDDGSQVGTDTVNATGQVIYTDYPQGDFSGIGDIFGKSAGTGFGVDLGGALELDDRLTVSLALINAFGSMSWKEDRLRYERASYTVALDANGTVRDTTSDSSLVGAEIDTDAQAVALRDSLLQTEGFARLLRGGVAYRVAGFTLGGDVQMRLSTGVDRQPDFMVGGGAEYVVLGFLPLRAGIRTDFGDVTAFSGGTGLRLGPFALDLSAAAIMGSSNPGVIVGAGFGLFF
jgi:hypothetical protein